MASSFPSQPEIPPMEFTGDESASADFDAQPASGGGWMLFRRILALLLILLVVILTLLVAFPRWRVQYISPRIESMRSGLPFAAGRDASIDQPLMGSDRSTGDQPGIGAFEDLIPTYTPTPTPHPAAALALEIDTVPGRFRWQIAYPGAIRGPGEGCAYLSFWLSGAGADDLDALQAIDAELVIYDGVFVFERYGPLPLERLRSLGDPRYYELPDGPPQCNRHRFTEVAQYAGLEFQLSLRAGNTIIHQYRGALTGADQSFATITPTSPPATPTSTPYPQVRIGQETNIRSGPGTSYTILGTARDGSIYPVTAVNAQRDWWQIDFMGQIGWVYAELVQASGVAAVGVDANVPPTPFPTATFAPPTPIPTATGVPTPYFPFLLESSGMCEANPAMTYFEGKVVNHAGEPLTGACVHVSYDGPRNTKCTGCDGAVAGKWGFAPFGNLPGKAGTTVRIYVVPCPEGGVPIGGQSPMTGFGPLYPVSPVWTYTVGESVQCTGITFKDNRFFDESGNQIPPPVPTVPPSAKELYRLNGEGQSFTTPFTLDAGGVLFKMQHSGRGTFGMQLVGSTGRNIDLLASGTGPFDGSKTVNIETKGTYFVSIIADGKWSIIIENP
ncbi:MAG: SH3 domain-containing protein [Caldilineaceae bacterium]|nr:SH3 domain-containing protein [Caldilineaceae bacterium]